MYGFICDYPISILGFLILFISIGYNGLPLWVWTIAGTIFFMGLSFPQWLIGAYILVSLIFIIKPIRAMLVSAPLMKLMKGFMPKISQTERTALEAGVVWVEGDLFSGKPDFKKLLEEPYPSLTGDEKAFLDNQTDKLCALIDDWALWKTKEIPTPAWEYIKKEKFLGMIIPKEYGGLGFSALAHSAVIMKLASRSLGTAVTVMVPNSLGPAELLVHYGTDEQKKFWLPKLANGDEIPAFALTEPTAGSDAGSILSEGTLFKGQDGKIYIRLNWNKRWITLAAISTVLGLAFKLRDPENLLGKGTDLGITAALIPTKTPGVVIGRRHDPLGVPFYNCPTQGTNVVVGLDAIVGGAEGAGKGWQMLMECLAAGRGISLPAQSTGGAKLALRAATNHAVIRKQFGVSIGKFEGIEEPLSRVAGYTYLLEAVRIFTCGALDKGIKPPVVTAMSKYYTTEISRKVANDAMDILGGTGISLGKRNLIGSFYIAAPIGITVEGANILTRTLMIFGQGALRAHPYAFKEVDTIDKGDVKGFDSAFFGHIGHVTRNLCRSIGLSVSRGYLACSPVKGPTAIYYRRLSWTSATFAILADVAMGVLGGSLKQKERITGRFADILSWMYICTAVLKRYEAEGQKESDLPYVHFAVRTGMTEIQRSFEGIFDNLKIPGLRWFVKGWIGAWSRINSLTTEVSDTMVHVIADTAQNDTELRDRLTDGIYIPKDPQEALGRLEKTYGLIRQSELIEKKIKKAVKDKVLPKQKIQKLWDEACKQNIITAEELKTLKDTEVMRFDAIQVDDFSNEEYKSLSTASQTTGLMKL